MEQKILEQLTETSKLYRFVSFFDLYGILVNHQLRMPKLSNCLDRNEGIGQILQFQDNELFRFRYTDKSRIADAHESVLESHYLTCWSLEPDMIAMWSLYSPDSMSIRISTTVGKLREVLHAHHEKMSWVNFMNEPGSRRPVSSGFALEHVEYVDFFKLRDEIRKKYQEFDKQVTLCFSQNAKYFDSADGFELDYEEFNRDKVVTRSGLFLKDRAYIHENEVRGIFHCGVRNAMTLEEYRAASNPLTTYLFDPAENGELQDNVYADVNAQFIETACFDPRMPQYKRKTYESVFKGVMPELVESKAFGYALDQESFASDYDGYSK